jgi:alkanesulfonate monooxygenase SsuD/methylene tetrahydromethanopterin reductase-like flavin-dependent oxidoreductase (luciferase family)
LKPRFTRFEEGLEVITRLLKSNAPVTFEGQYYQLREATLLPHPDHPGGPRILIGGNGEKRTIPLAVKYADEWNGVFLRPAEFARLNTLVDEALDACGRERESVRRSLMTGLRFGRTRKELEALLSSRGHTCSGLRKRGILVGVGQEIKEQLSELEKTGISRIMLQWLELEDLKGLEALAKVVL